MKLIVSVLILLSLAFLLWNQQGTILKLGKTAGRIANLETPCEETGVRLSEYQELIRLAAVSCQSSDVAKHIADVKYCFPEAEIELPRLKNVNTYFFQPGDAAAVCIHEDFFDDERDNIIKHCYDAQSDIQDIIGNYYDNIRFSRCIFSNLEERGLMRRNVDEGGCGKFTTIGHIDSPGMDCLEPKFATKYDDEYPSVTYSLQGTCPEDFKELASRKMFSLGQASKPTLSVLEHVDELPKSFDALEIIPVSAIYEEIDNNKEGQVYFRIKNTGEFNVNLAFYLATGESEAYVNDAIWPGGRRERGGLSGLGAQSRGSSGRLSLAAGQQKVVQAFITYKKMFIPFTLHLHVDFFNQHIPIGAIKVPATPTLFLRPYMVHVLDEEKHSVVLSATNPFSKPAAYSPIFTIEPELDVVSNLRQRSIAPGQTEDLTLIFSRDGYSGPVTIKMYPSQQAKADQEEYREPFVVTQNGLPTGMDSLVITEEDGITENDAPTHLQGQVQQRLSRSTDRYAVGDDLIVAPKTPSRCPGEEPDDGGISMGAGGFT